jgi:hypothetical protein
MARAASVASGRFVHRSIGTTQPRRTAQSLGLPITGNSRSTALSCSMMDGRKVWVNEVPKLEHEARLAKDPPKALGSGFAPQVDVTQRIELEPKLEPGTPWETRWPPA